MILFWTRLRKAILGAYDHSAFLYAKAAAYSALLAFLPVLTTTTAILVHFNAAAVSRRITAVLFKVAPAGVEELLRIQMTQQGSRPLAVPIAASILAFWAASGVMMSLMEGFQAAYQRKSSRSVLHERWISIWLVVISIGPVLGATVLMIFGDWMETRALMLLGLLDAGESVAGGVKFLSMAVRYAVSAGAIVAVAGLLYKYGPDAGTNRRVWQGSLLATALWLLITSIFGWYVRNISNYNVLYGTIGAVMALCVWMFLLALSAMVGCEFNIQSDPRKKR